MDKKQQLEKLLTLHENPALAVFDALNEVNDNLKALAEAVQSSKSEVVSVTNLADAKTDLSPLEANFEALKGAVEQVTGAIKAIPKDSEVDMSGVEKLLKELVNRPVEKMDMSHMETMSDILDNILFAVQTTATHSNDKEEELVPEFAKVLEILNLLNENVVAIDIPSLDYEKLARIIKANVQIKVSGGGGPSHVKATIQNGGQDVNVATSEKQGQHYDIETAQWANTTGADGAVHSMSYTSAIAMGHIAGHSSFRGFGQRQTLSAVVSGDDIWEGTATTCPLPPDAGDLMSIVSTSANDTSAGTGVRSVDIHYLDPSGNSQSIVVATNGLTAVDTGILMRFVQSIHSETVGSNGTAVGTISIYKTGSVATVYNVIVPGGNMSLNAARMIPLGKIFYMTNLSVSGASNKAISIKLRSTSTFEDVITTGNFFLFKDVTFAQNSTREKTFRVPLKFPALSVLKATAYSSQAGGDISFNYDGWIE